MLRRLLDFQLSLTEKGKPLHCFRPLMTAADTFLYEAPVNTTRGPHIRDAIDIKRWMLIVVIALLPCVFMAIWNSGIQSFVYSSGDYSLMAEYLDAASSWDGYMSFATKDNRYLTIIKLGLIAFLPILLVSYIVGGIWEALFAIFRGHEISEGFLVTGLLYPLILPSTIPYWMAAVGVSAGIVLAKEIFGGSGMNIVNPALSCRAFLFFTFPARMSGDVWVGTNTSAVRQSLVNMNLVASSKGVADGYSQATPLAIFNVKQEIKKIHVDAIASNNVPMTDNSVLESTFDKWNQLGSHDATFGQLTQEQMQQFVTNPTVEGGLGLSSGYYQDAYDFSSLNYGIGHPMDWNLFFGDRLGSMGETSVVASLIGAAILLWTGVGSWRTMLGMTLGAFGTALLFQFGSALLAADGGAWLPAQFGFPAYKHLIMGGLAFGIVFMATDPVSSPSMNSAKWVYGVFCGFVTIIIRVINPAYPEGVMLAILTGNVFAPLFDHYAARIYRKRRAQRVRATA